MPVRKVIIDKANRLYQMPPAISDFVVPGHRLLAGKRSGVLDLASFFWPVVPDPDFRPEGDQLLAASSTGMAALKEELAGWLTRVHSARIVPDRELYIGGGITSLAYQLTLAYVDTGDVAFVPGVGIPLYRSCVTACNGEPIPYPISAKTEWIPRFDRLNTGLGRVARLLFLNSPHNPTGAELSSKDLAELAWLAGRQNILIVNDAAYAAISSRAPASLLDTAGGKKVGVELGSFCYQFGLPPLPFGYAVGSREAISGMEKAARLVRRFVPAYAVELAIDAIRGYPSPGLTAIRDRISRASAEASQLMDLLRLEPAGRPTVPFEWAQTERRTPSTSIAKTLARRFGVLVTPGLSFGENGEGFFRFSLLASPGAFAEAARRIRKSRLIRKREDEP